MCSKPVSSIALAILSAVFCEMEPPVRYRETVLLDTPQRFAISMMFMSPPFVSLFFVRLGFLQVFKLSTVYTIGMLACKRYEKSGEWSEMGTFPNIY